MQKMRKEYNVSAECQSDNNIHIMSSRSEDLQTDSVTEICKGCSLPIHVKNLVYDGESYWHHKCFVCGQCNSSLVNTKYYDKNGSLFCNNCFLAEHLPTCFRCGVEIKGRGSLGIFSRERYFYEAMFSRRGQDEL